VLNHSNSFLFTVIEASSTDISPLNKSKIILARTEIKRIEKIIKSAVKQFAACLSSEELAEFPFAQEDEFSELAESEDDLLDGLEGGAVNFENDFELEFGYPADEGNVDMESEDIVRETEGATDFQDYLNSMLEACK